MYFSFSAPKGGMASARPRTKTYSVFVCDSDSSRLLAIVLLLRFLYNMLLYFQSYTMAEVNNFRNESTNQDLAEWINTINNAITRQLLLLLLLCYLLLLGIFFFEWLQGKPSSCFKWLQGKSSSCFKWLQGKPSSATEGANR